jgi:putative membrane protein
MLDLSLAIAHHLLIFGLAAILAMTAALVRPQMTSEQLARVARIDTGYGLIAGLIIVVGVLRVIYGGKGWLFYSSNPFFWAKIAAFVLVGLLSIGPTIAFLRWRKAERQGGELPAPDQIARVRRLILAQLVVFAFIPIFAAAMARGIGL